MSRKATKLCAAVSTALIIGASGALADSIGWEFDPDRPADRQTFEENFAAFDTFDADRDGFLNDDEFMDRFTDTRDFGTWDTNADGLLDRREFNDGAFSHYDRNDNDLFEEKEYLNLRRDEEEGLWGG